MGRRLVSRLRSHITKRWPPGGLGGFSFSDHIAALGSDHGKDTPDERCGNRPARAREEAHAEPDEDQLEVNGRRHGGFSRYDENR